MSSDIAERLKHQTSSLVGRFTHRVSMLRGHSEFSSLVRGVDEKSAIREAIELLSKGDHLAVGIDGSMGYDERLEMLLFYVCATAFKCPLQIDDNVRLNISQAERDSRLSVSAAVPLWLEDLSDVSKSNTDEEFEYTLERIPYALMTLGELTLALNSVENKDVKIIFLDRSLHGTFGPASRDLRMLLRMGESSLTTFTTQQGKLSMLDLRLAYILGPGNLYVPRREPYLVYRAIRVLIDKGEMKKEDLARELGLDDKGIEKVLRRLDLLNKRYEGRLIEKSDLISIELKADVKGYWIRVLSVVKEVCRRVFKGKEHPLQIGDDKWLTVLDLNAVNIFLIYELLNQSSKKKILVIGITKDTNASDFTRSVIPLAIHKEILKPKPSSPLPNLKNDRAFLTIMAAVNGESIMTPWRTVGYDTCFTTLVESNDPNIRLRAARKIVSRERLFVKAYFQLRTFATDTLTRSPIFLYDRFYYPDFDERSSGTVVVLERDRERQIEPYFEALSINPLDNLILYILLQSDNPEVLEAFGHNQLLYLADKAVKAEIRSMRGMLRGVADLQLDTLARKERIFSISRRFRDLRAESEMIRSKRAMEATEA